MQVDLRRNWSLYFKTYMQLVLEYYHIIDSQSEMVYNSVIIKIRN